MRGQREPEHLQEQQRPEDGHVEVGPHGGDEAVFHIHQKVHQPGLACNLVGQARGDAGQPRPPICCGANPEGTDLVDIYDVKVRGGFFGLIVQSTSQVAQVLLPDWDLAVGPPDVECQGEAGALEVGDVLDVHGNVLPDGHPDLVLNPYSIRWLTFTVFHASNMTRKTSSVFSMAPSAAMVSFRPHRRMASPSVTLSKQSSSISSSNCFAKMSGMARAEG